MNLAKLNPLWRAPGKRWWDWDGRHVSKAPNHRHSIGGGGGGGGGSSRAKAPGYKRAPLQELAFREAVKSQLGVTRAQQFRDDVKSGKALARAMGRPAPRSAPAGRQDARQIDPELAAELEAFLRADRPEGEDDSEVDMWAEVVDPDAVILDDEDGITVEDL